MSKNFLRTLDNLLRIDVTSSYYNGFLHLKLLISCGVICEASVIIIIPRTV